jgi:hypothetical protein
MFQHLFDIVLSCQSTFDGSVQCLPKNLGTPFQPKWSLLMPLVVPIAKWQHFVLAYDTLFGTKPILPTLHYALMSPLKFVSPLHSFAFIMPLEHVLQC